MRLSFAKANLNWYEYGWAMVPLVLAPVGGLIGGLCGGAAAAANIYVFSRKLRTLTKFVISGAVSVVVVISYMFLAQVVTVAILSEARVDRELQALPAYAALKKVDPEGYAKMLQRVVQLKTRFRPQVEVQAAASSALKAAILRFQVNASDEALIDRTRIMALEIDQIGAKNIDACADFLSAHPAAPVNLKQYVTPEVLKLEEASTVAVLETGSTGQHTIPEKKEVESSLSQIRAGLIAEFGEDDVVKFGSGQITDHAKLCKMNSAFFKLALSLPHAQAASVFRFIFGQSSTS